MQQEAAVQSALRAQQEPERRDAVIRGSKSHRVTAVCLLAGAAFATLFNVLFPRADDPSDTAAVLTMMAENEALRQGSFLGVTAGLWLLTAGISGICKSLDSEPTATWARFGFYGVLVGAALFTVSTGIGLAATEAAIGWVNASADSASVEFAAASALNAADDGVWSMSIVTYWLGLGLVGLAILGSRSFPMWSGWTLLLLGFGNAAFTGLPMAFSGVSQGLILAFAVLAQLTILWAFAMGVWILRRSR